MATELPRTGCEDSTLKAVCDVMACADIAVGSIGRQAEREMEAMLAEARARPSREALERRQRLAQLREELTEQAAAIALSYASIVEDIGAVDSMLRGQARDTVEGATVDAGERVGAVRMTLRERVRTEDSDVGRAKPKSDAPWVERTIGRPEGWPPERKAERESSWPAGERPVVEAKAPRRRFWRRWKPAA